MKTSVAVGVVAVMLSSCSENQLAPRVPKSADGLSALRAAGAEAAYRLLLAPWRIERGAGKPGAVTKSLAARGYAPDAIFHVRNGDASGAARVSSARVLVDGRQVLGPSDFSQAVAGYDLPITIGGAVELSVEVDGKPGGYLTVSIDARPATSATLSPAGGVLYLLVDAVTLSAPAGAVAAPLVITATPMATPPMSGGVTPVSAVEIGPNGTRFAAPVTLSLAFDPATLPRGVPEALLRMFWWDGRKWIRLTGQTMDAVNHRVSALTDHFTVFALLPDYRFCPTDPTSFTSLQLAVNGTPSGGTLVVCDGLHDVTRETPVRVNHPMTIRSERLAGATLQRTGLTNEDLFFIDGVASGTVKFADIALRGDGVMIDATNIYDQLVVDSVSFVGNDTIAGSAGLAATGSSVPGARTTVTNSSFYRFEVGVFAHSSVEFNTIGNVFDLFGWSSVQYQYGAYGRVANNILTHCGAKGCIRVGLADGVTIEQNTMSTAGGSAPRIAIFIHRRADGGKRAFIVRDNTITGTAPAGDPADLLNWPLSTAIRLYDGAPATADTILRNHITNAWEAIRLLNGTTTVFDNTANGGRTGITMFNAGSATVQRNDFLNFAVGIQQIFLPGTTTPIMLNAQCNWWGTTNGPANPGSVPRVDFFPWAMQPIARATTACAPQP